jgi:hypothetical protein
VASDANHAPGEASHPPMNAPGTTLVLTVPLPADITPAMAVELAPIIAAAAQTLAQAAPSIDATPTIQGAVTSGGGLPAGVSALVLTLA